MDCVSSERQSEYYVAHRPEESVDGGVQACGGSRVASLGRHMLWTKNDVNTKRMGSDPIKRVQADLFDNIENKRRVVLRQSSAHVHLVYSKRFACSEHVDENVAGRRAVSHGRKRDETRRRRYLSKSSSRSRSRASMSPEV